ncbi:MAG TPA: SdrD B-like domain-containing protein [Abditibacterium sp.]|jgi:hypothetical protein
MFTRWLAGSRARRSHCYFGVLAVGLASALPANASPKTRLLFNLGIRGEVMGNDLNSRFQLDHKGQITGMHTRLSGSRVQSEFGDLSDNWDDLSFASRGFYGVKLGVPTGNITTTLLGGSVAIQDARGRSEISPLYGVRAAWKLNRNLSLNASQLLTPNASDEQGKLISALSLGYALRQNVRLGMEVARSSGGTGWQVSALHAGRNLTAKALFRNVDDGFSSAGNPNLSRERSGYSTEIRTKVGPLSLGGASQRFVDGRGGREFADSASLDFSRRGLPSVSLYWQSSEQLSLPFSLDFQGESFSGATENERRLQLQPTQSRRAGLQISHTLAATNFSLGFSRNQSRLTQTPLSAQSSDSLSFSASRSLGSRTSARFFGSWNLNSAAQINANQTGRVTQIELNHLFTNGIGLNCGLQRQQFRFGPVRGNALISDVGFLLPLGGRASVGLQYRASLGGSKALLAGADRMQIRFSRDFGVGKKRKSNARTVQQRRLLGRIAGRVFDDGNNNGRWDEGEVAVAGVAVSLQNGVQTRTDSQGKYHFDDLVTRKYQVALVNKTLPLEFAVLSTIEAPIATVAGQTTLVDFPAVRTGQIKGIIFEDNNRNGQQEAGETMLSGVMVQIEGSEVISFSNERGEFNLSNLPAQTWKISADTSSMDGDYETTASAPIEIKVVPNGVVTGVLLGVAAQSRGIVNTFQKSQ